ncbi:MAG: GtrA family protein [Steroidobacteraceae bacterium]
MTASNRWVAQFLRFAMVGALCTVIQYLLLAAGVEWLEMDAVVASTLGYLASAVANYLLNRRYTYGSGAPHATLVLRFVAVLVTGLALNTLFMQLLHGYLQWQYMLAQLCATAVNLLWNFSAHRHWTFLRSN